MKKEDLKEIKRLLNNYYDREFRDTINYSTLIENIRDLGLAYTLDEENIKEDETPKEVQISTDILNKKVFTYYDNKLVEVYLYSTLKEYKEFLTHLDYDELIFDTINTYGRLEEV